MSPATSAAVATDKLPTVVRVDAGESRVSLILKVPASLAFFPGHFPIHAILPGVVQIDWAIHFGRQHFPLLPQFRKMEALKFQAIIEPEQEVTLSLEHKAGSDPQQPAKLLFSFDSARGRHSSGRIVFAAEAAAA